MMYEERKDVVIVKGGQKELEELKEKHGLTRGEGVCILASDAPRVLKADVPDDAFYKEKISNLMKERDAAIAENLKLSNLLNEAGAKIEDQKGRIAKLEHALIEASIK